MRAVILVERGFQDEEFIYPYYRMQEAGWSVAVATPFDVDVRGKYGVPVRSDAMLRTILPDDFDAVLIPGGFECPDRLRIMPEVQKFVRAMDAAGKLIAAICHGPWVCISAGIVRGRNMAGYQSLRDDLTNAGAHYSHAAVVTDGNLITADHYRSLGPFMKSVIEWRPVRLEVTHV
jgi:protease I